MTQCVFTSSVCGKPCVMHRRCGVTNNVRPPVLTESMRRTRGSGMRKLVVVTTQLRGMRQPVSVVQPRVNRGQRLTCASNVSRANVCTVNVMHAASDVERVFSGTRVQFSHVYAMR